MVYIPYGAILEVRMGSTRLPGKSMMDVTGAPLIKRVVDRVKLSKKVNKVILATTKNTKDDVLEKFAKEEDIDCFRGSEENVLERVVFAARKYQVKHIVELHGDNPFLDPKIIDSAVELYETSKCDYVSNTLEKTFPSGVRVQVFPTKELEKIYNTIDDPAVNEHVSLYFYEHPELYNIVNLKAPPEINRPEIRLTVDTEKDLKLVRIIYQKLIEQKKLSGFSTRDVIEVIDRYELKHINIDVSPKPLWRKN